LPEQGFDVAKLLVGSEGTLVTVLHAELELVPVVAHTAMRVLVFPALAAAAAAVPDVLDGSPVTPLLVEAMDDETTGLMHHERAHTASPRALPAGSACATVEV